MSGTTKFKFTDLIPRPLRMGGRKGMPHDTERTVAEQTREGAEDQEARDSVPSHRDRMVDIGRGGQQAGRQGE